MRILSSAFCSFLFLCLVQLVVVPTAEAQVPSGKYINLYHATRPGPTYINGSGPTIILRFRGAAATVPHYMKMEFYNRPRGSAAGTQWNHFATTSSNGKVTAYGILNSSGDVTLEYKVVGYVFCDTSALVPDDNGNLPPVLNEQWWQAGETVEYVFNNPAGGGGAGNGGPGGR